MSDQENSFSLENLQEKRSATENRIPRSPAVDTYESYASWRKKKFPPKPLDYKAEDYTLSKPEGSNDNYSNQNPPNPNFQKSSYFPIETQNPPSENYSNRSPSASMPPRSSYFSPDSENLHSRPKIDSRRSLPASEGNYLAYNPNAFQAKESEDLQNSNQGMKTSSPMNKISREAQHYLKMYSARSDNPPLNSNPRNSNPRNSSPRFSRRPNSHSPNPQNSNCGNLRSNHRDFIPDANSRRAPVDYDPRSNPNAGALQPVRHKSDHRHSFPSCCPMEHKREPENGEMIKGLLKLIDNQSEQIRNLQAQLDHLLSIHEETLKEKAKCICSLEISRQNPQICMQAYNAALQQTSSIGTENYHQGLSKIQDSNQVSNEASNRRNVQFEDHSKKNVVERKVSIGVMTSFEFTVQNSPFNLENEDQPVVEDQDEEIYKEGEKNLSNLELLRRKQNIFSMMPSPLENIIEDSESHLSSSQQPSSNCLSSCKSGNVQTQIGRNRSNNSNANTANKANNPSNFNTSSQTSPGIQNYSTNPNSQNIQNRRDSGQNIETRNQRDVGRDSKKNASPVTRNEPGNRETIPNSRRSGTPHRSEDPGTVNRSPDFCRREENRREENRKEENRKERQNERVDRRENNRNEDNFQDDSMNLSGGQLEVRERIPPSPEPSIHVDMQEYSSEEGSVQTKRTPKVGWTFYNNVLGQVNHILQNSPTEKEDARSAKGPERKEFDDNVLMDTVKAATMDQLKKLGISFVDNNEAKEANANKK